MKIALHLDDKRYRNKNFENPLDGNMGIGETEYEVLLLAELLKDANEVYLFHYNGSNIVAPDLNNVMIQNENQMITLAKENNMDVIITPLILVKEWYRELEQNNIRAIIWATNYLEYYEEWILQELTENPNICKVVCVSRGMYEQYLSNIDLRKKLAWVYNIIIADSYKIRENYEPWVTYMGGISYQEGFHILAVCWKNILEIVPDAKLHVIGSGQLYGSDMPLGKYQIASEEYENEFMQYLTDETGELLESVVFHGNMGVEKKEILNKTSVGVVNPSGLTETFCISAAEFSACGIPVVTKDVPGIYDTVKENENGLLYRDDDYRTFLSSIVHLLMNHDQNVEFGHDGRKLVEAEFGIEKNKKKWEKIIEDCLSERTDGGKNPLISVIIPTYNRKQFISRAIDSVLNQTYENFEIIIVDDNSNDDTQSHVVERYGDLSNIIYIVNDSNVGAAGARNIGVQYARGEYIAFQDSDDEWLADKLEKQMMLFDSSDQNIGMIYSQIRWNWSGGHKEEFPPKTVEEKYKSGDTLLAMLLYCPLVGAPTMLIKKECFCEVGGFNEQLRTLEDYEFSIRFSEKYKILLCDEPLVNVYETEGSVGKQNDEKIRTLLYMMKEFSNEYKQFNLQQIKMKSVFAESKLYGNLNVLEESISILGDDSIYMETYKQLMSEAGI